VKEEAEHLVVMKKKKLDAWLWLPLFQQLTPFSFLPLWSLLSVVLQRLTG
jgi:hypothetical protein